jgi:molybdopterin molybdotransferase
MKQNVSLEEAQNLLMELVSPPEVEFVPLDEAFGRVISQTIAANASLPFFDRSPLDGYALLAADTLSATLLQPVRLRVLEEVPAGYVASADIVSGTAIKLMTGAPVPAGADVVIKYEDISRQGDIIEVFQPLKSRSNIVYTGEDLKQGEAIAEPGMIVTPSLIGLMASLGMTAAPVYRRIKAAVLSTGDELLSGGEPLQPGKIYDSNRYVLQARCRELGIIPVLLKNAADNKAIVAGRILEGLERADLVITTGGVSVGDYDVVKDALQSIDADCIFWKVAIKPGAPIVAAIKANKLIIGLSGNPVAALLTFELLVIPLLKKMMGRRNCLYTQLQGVLANSYKKPSDKRRFLRGRLIAGNGNFTVELAGIQNNSALASMLECNVFVDVPAGSGPLVAGDSVSVVVIGNSGM